MVKRTVAAGQFKQGCLAILDEVAEQRIEVVITKRGKPLAKLVPLTSRKEKEEEILARLRSHGRVLVSEKEFLKPTASEAGWRLGRK